ncbi:hypothetical protein ACDT16_13740 [Staphylococcus aureus]
MKECGYPRGHFRVEGWVHPDGSLKNLTQWILGHYQSELKQLGLFRAIQATEQGIEINQSLFLALLERYHEDTGTFFFPGGEMGLALHEMYDISKLPWGDEPYEEYTPSREEFMGLENKYPDMMEVYKELLSHYQSCVALGGANSVPHAKKWREHLFTEHAKAAPQFRYTLRRGRKIEEIEEMMATVKPSAIPKQVESESSRPVVSYFYQSLVKLAYRLWLHPGGIAP